ncbi:MAG TPA: hypothetical protein VF933_36700, partial [Streptosporangiaceae bacterium]
MAQRVVGAEGLGRLIPESDRSWGLPGPVRRARRLPGRGPGPVLRGFRGRSGGPGGSRAGVPGQGSRAR